MNTFSGVLPNKFKLNLFFGGCWFCRDVTTLLSSCWKLERISEMRFSYFSTISWLILWIITSPSISLTTGSSSLIIPHPKFHSFYKQSRIFIFGIAFESAILTATLECLNRSTAWVGTNILFDKVFVIWSYY